MTIVQDKENKKQAIFAFRTKITLKVRKCKKITNSLHIIKKQITSQITLFHWHRIQIFI